LQKSSVLPLHYLAEIIYGSGTLSSHLLFRDYYTKNKPQAATDLLFSALLLVYLKLQWNEQKTSTNFRALTEKQSLNPQLTST